MYIDCDDGCVRRRSLGSDSVPVQLDIYIPLQKTARLVALHRCLFLFAWVHRVLFRGSANLSHCPLLLHSRIVRRCSRFRYYAFHPRPVSLPLRRSRAVQ